jgi:hypothetical protein
MKDNFFIIKILIFLYYFTLKLKVIKFKIKW